MSAERPRLVRFAPAVVWAGVIFVASTSWCSGEHTGRALLGVLGRLFPGADVGTLEAVHAALRKLAHLVEYLILGILVARGLRDGGPWRPRHAILATLAAAAYAITDELHQAFVPGRTAAATDVAIDTAGAALGQLALALRRPTR